MSDKPRYYKQVPGKSYMSGNSLTSIHYVDCTDEVEALLASQVAAARHQFFEHQFDINDAWAKYHGDLTYEQFAENYLAQLTTPDKEEARNDDANQTD